MRQHQPAKRYGTSTCKRVQVFTCKLVQIFNPQRLQNLHLDCRTSTAKTYNHRLAQSVQIIDLPEEYRSSTCQKCKRLTLFTPFSAGAPGDHELERARPGDLPEPALVLAAVRAGVQDAGGDSWQQPLDRVRGVVGRHPHLPVPLQGKSAIDKTSS
jgi:hypothetical protein